MGCPASTSSFSLISSLALSTLVALSGFSLSCEAQSTKTSAVKRSPISKRPGWEFAVQSFTDQMKLKQNAGEDIPLATKAYGVYAGYSGCLSTYSGRNCLNLTGGLAYSSAVVESESPSYTYWDGGATVMHGHLGLGLRHHFARSRSTASLLGDLEVRKADYKTPGPQYSIREENLAFHYWVRAQFNFPISAKLSFYQAMMFSPTSEDFSYRIGLAL